MVSTDGAIVIDGFSIEGGNVAAGHAIVLICIYKGIVGIRVICILGAIWIGMVVWIEYVTILIGIIIALIEVVGVVGIILEGIGVGVAVVSLGMVGSIDDIILDCITRYMLRPMSSSLPALLILRVLPNNIQLLLLGMLHLFPHRCCINQSSS